jgi:hypothetical protein
MDVMVSMAVIAVLISLLTPSLAHVRETAHQVVCRSNVRQMGIGIFQYAEQNQDMVPRSYSVAENKPWDSIYLLFGDEHPSHIGVWDGLGILANPDENLLPAPKLYYCPSHRGNNPYSANLDQWAHRQGPIVGNYQYRGRGTTPTGTRLNPRFTLRLSGMSPNTALVADGLRYQSDFNHVVGANVLRASLAVDWHSDRGIFNGLPKEGQAQSSTQFEDNWGRFEGDGDR